MIEQRPLPEIVVGLRKVNADQAVRIGQLEEANKRLQAKARDLRPDSVQGEFEVQERSAA